MSINYKPAECKNCRQYTSGQPSYGQWVIFYVLLLCFILPGVIYYFVAKPNRCYNCGIKRRHQAKAYEKSQKCC